ncbi:MAG: DNA alkylation repair protein [Roseinatronobacter sp.]
MTSAVQVLDALRARGDPARAAEMAAYHKTERDFLGLPAAELDVMARDLRHSLPLAARCDLAQALWESGVHEGAIFAAKLLTQARIRPEDEAVWQIIARWAQGFDSWAVADCASIAGSKRLQADPRRLDQIEDWTRSPNIWTRRAALVMTLPWARLPHPKADDLAVRARVLGWAESYVSDRDWFIQKAVAWWLRELSRRDVTQVQAFLDGPGAALAPFARKDALRLHAP